MPPDLDAPQYVDNDVGQDGSPRRGNRANERGTYELEGRNKVDQEVSNQAASHPLHLPPPTQGQQKAPDQGAPQYVDHDVGQDSSPRRGAARVSASSVKALNASRKEQGPHELADRNTVDQEVSLQQAYRVTRVTHLPPRCQQKPPDQDAPQYVDHDVGQDGSSRRGKRVSSSSVKALNTSREEQGPHELAGRNTVDQEVSRQASYLLHIPPPTRGQQKAPDQGAPQYVDHDVGQDSSPRRGAARVSASSVKALNTSSEERGPHELADRNKEHEQP